MQARDTTPSFALVRVGTDRAAGRALSAMSRRPSRVAGLRLRLLSITIVAAALAIVGCGAATQPQLKVISVERSERAPTRQAVVYVEVVNRADHPMHLQRLQYTFAAAGAARPGGEVSLTRVVEPGAAVLVEVPVSIDDDTWADGEHLTLDGRLFCEEASLVRSFAVSADVPAPADL
jgi:hypothetical protein